VFLEQQEGECDTEDWSQFSFASHHITVLNCIYITHCYCTYTVFLKLMQPYITLTMLHNPIFRV